MYRIFVLFVLLFFLLGCRGGAAEIAATATPYPVIETIEVEVTRQIENVVEVTRVVEVEAVRESAELTFISTPEPIQARISDVIFYQSTPITVSVDIWIDPLTRQRLVDHVPGTITPTVDVVDAFSVTVLPIYYQSDFKPRCYQISDEMCQLDEEHDPDVPISAETVKEKAAQFACPDLAPFINGGIAQLIDRESEFIQFALKNDGIGLLQLSSYWFFRYWEEFRKPLTDVFDLDAQFEVGCWLMREDLRSSGNPLRQWSGFGHHAPTISAEITSEQVRPYSTPSPTVTIPAENAPLGDDFNDAPPSIYDVTVTPIVYSEPIRTESSSLSAAAKQTVLGFGCEFVVNIASGGGWLCVVRSGVDLPPLPLPFIDHDVQRVIREAHPHADYRWFDRQALAFGAYAVSVNYFDAGSNPWDIKTNQAAALQQYDANDFWVWPWSRIQLQP